jgi:hypothetical protein
MRSEELYDLLIKRLCLFRGDHVQIKVDLERPNNYSVTIQGSPIDLEELMSLSRLPPREIKNYFYRVLMGIPSDFNDSVQRRLKYFNSLFNDSLRQDSSPQSIINFIYQFFHQGGLLHLVSAAFLQATSSFWVGAYASSSKSDTFFQYDDQSKRLIVSQYASVFLTNVETDKVCSNFLSLLLTIPVSEISKLKRNEDGSISLIDWIVDLTIHSLDSEIMNGLNLGKSYYTKFPALIENLSEKKQAHLQESLLYYVRAQRSVRIPKSNFMSFSVELIKNLWKSKLFFLRPSRISFKKKCVELLFNVSLTDRVLENLFSDLSKENIELFFIIYGKQEKIWTQTALLNALHVCKKLKEFGLWDDKDNAHELLCTIKTLSDVKIQSLQDSIQKLVKKDEKPTDSSPYKVRIRTSLLTGFFHCPAFKKTNELQGILENLFNEPVAQSSGIQSCLQRSGSAHRA